MIPAFAAAKLPLHISWARFFSDYWIYLTLTSTFVATFLCLAGFPLRMTLLPLWHRYWSQKAKFVFLALFGVAMVWEFGSVVGLLLIVDTIALIEIVDRKQWDLHRLTELALAVFLPATYLFAGLVVLFCYNDLIASVRYYGSYDAAFNRLDAFLFHGLTVSALVHLALAHFPLSFFEFLEIIYYGMFTQIGAAFIITALCFGRKRSFEFAGTLLTAYYISLGIFFIWPSIGPFAFCPIHPANYPHTLATYDFQQIGLEKARALWTHQPTSPVNTDFFIAFPSMHIAQPLIILWFLRKWRRIAAILIAYDVLLLAAIILLEWHYFVDLLGGALVAAVAIAMINFSKQATDPGGPQALANNDLEEGPAASRGK